MQINYLHPSIYKGYKALRPIESLDAAQKMRSKTLHDWDKLKEKGLSDKECQEITGISRATFYRRKKALQTFGTKGLLNRSKRPKSFRKSQIPQKIHDLILHIRLENPTYGKAKITAILRRDHDIELSESTVGRILKSLMESGKIQKYAAAKRHKRARKFNNHARRWRFEKPQNMGEMIQIDHMSVAVHNTGYKHFKAVDPISKVMVTELYHDAKAKTAEKFLEKVMAKMPFNVASIQVDGGSEFMKEFEQACANQGIPLFVLPPKSPKYNGCVERGNRTFREDFYNQKRHDMGENICEIRRSLEKMTAKYNDYRPHQNLNFLTPMEYVNINTKKAA